MTLTPFEQALPGVMGWIGRLLADHAMEARQVGELGFQRLPQYFSRELLMAKVVLVDCVPIPPLSEFGITGFDELEQLDAIGITYLDTFFIKRSHASDEPLHFHEMIHVAQWHALGPKDFLTIYADGLTKFGYRRSPLEAMAYDLENQFKHSLLAFDAEQQVRKHLESSLN